jgi:hypothetical protein
VPALLELLRDSSHSVREAAASALGAAGGSDPRVVPALLELLRDNSDDVRAAAASALGAAGGSNPRVVPALLELLRDDVRAAAASALGGAGGSDPRVVPALLGLLRDGNYLERRAAAHALLAAASTDPITMPSILHHLWRIANRGISPFGDTPDAIARIVEGRQLPGYRWTSLKARRLRWGKLRKIALGTATALAITLAIWFGAGWIAGLPADNPTKLFLTSVPAVATLLGLLWGLVLVVRGEKRTLWG